MENEYSPLVKSLIETGYGQLFHLSTYENLDEIWAGPGHPDALKNLVVDDKAPMEARFLAVEILQYKDAAAAAEIEPSVLALIYSSALKGSGGSPSDFGVYGNSWGFMSYLEGQGLEGAGVLGQRLLALGTEALPALVQLLQENATLAYEGSKEATVGNSLRFRVKDAAAYYIAKIRNLKIEYLDAWTDRDKMISKLGADSGQ